MNVLFETEALYRRREISAQHDPPSSDVWTANTLALATSIKVVEPCSMGVSQLILGDNYRHLFYQPTAHSIAHLTQHPPRHLTRTPTTLHATLHPTAQATAHPVGW